MSMPPEQNAKGSINKLNTLNKGLGVGFVGIDSYMRVKEGESAPVAIGKSLLTNAAWAMAPGGLVGGIAIAGGIAATQAIPSAINNINERTSRLGQNLNRFGSNFQSTEAQRTMEYQGINQIEQARTEVARQMSGHAKRAQRVY